MKWAKSILAFSLMIPVVISCKSRSSRNQLKADIREIDQSVRVIYREGNTVFLVTCPLENREVNDHIDDEKVLGRASCNDKTAAKDTSGKPQVQTMAFDSEYEPKLKQALAVQGVTNKADIDALKAKIAVQQNKLDKLVASGLNTNANSDLIEKQAAKVNQNLEALKAQLGTGGDAETKIELLNTLISYLDVNSKAAFNIAQSEAGQLLAPFGGQAGSSGAVGQCGTPNSLGMVFCPIPRGTFTMGSPQNETDRNNDETQHQVTLSKDFEMMATEVTQAMWSSIVGSSPSRFKDPASPVEQVSWNDITNDFLPKLNDKLRSEGYTYRLPTEAEWEYAARGEKPGQFGIDGDLKDFGWFTDNSGQKTNPVGKLKSNKYGLFDMHGNVWEWVQDAKADYPSGAVTDPLVTAGSNRVLRGGSWVNTSRFLRSAGRIDVGPDGRNSVVGFRLVRTR
jgi:formylglycine-generating enzyme required for sulfatase activity